MVIAEQLQHAFDLLNEWCECSMAVARQLDEQDLAGAIKAGDAGEILDADRTLNLQRLFIAAGIAGLAVNKRLDQAIGALDNRRAQQSTEETGETIDATQAFIRERVGFMRQALTTLSTDGVERKIRNGLQVDTIDPGAHFELLEAIAAGESESVLAMLRRVELEHIALAEELRGIRVTLAAALIKSRRERDS